MNAARYASKAQGVSQKVGMTLMESVRILFTHTPSLFVDFTWRRYSPAGRIDVAC